MVTKMVVHVFVLVQADPSQIRHLVEAISKITGVKTVHPTTGLYDIIVFAEVYDLKTLSTFLLTEICQIEGVKRTQTAIVLK